MTNTTIADLPKPPPHMDVPREGRAYPSPLLVSGVDENAVLRGLYIHVYPGPQEFEYPLHSGMLWYEIPMADVQSGPHYIHTRLIPEGSPDATWYDTGWFYVKTPPE